MCSIVLKLLKVQIWGFTPLSIARVILGQILSFVTCGGPYVFYKSMFKNDTDYWGKHSFGDG